MFHGEAHLLFTYREKQLCFHTEAHLCFTFVKSTKTQLRFKPKHYRISLLKKKTLKHNCASCGRVPFWAACMEVQEHLQPHTSNSIPQMSAAVPGP